MDNAQFEQIIKKLDEIKGLLTSTYNEVDKIEKKNRHAIIPKLESILEELKQK